MNLDELQSALVWLFPALLGFAAVRDIVSYEVPNWLSVALAVAFAATALRTGSELGAVLWHFGAGAAVLVIGWALFCLGVFGGGDAKLLAACAVWTGWEGLAKFALLVALLGGAIALILLVVRRARGPASSADRAWTRRLLAADQGMPYCVAIALGGLWMFPEVKAGLPLS